MAGLFRKFAKPFKLENRKEAKAHSSAQPVPNASHSKQPAAERPATAPTHLQVERELLWKKAYEALRKEKPQLVANLETIIKNDANLPEKTDIFSSEGIAAVSLSQKKRMEDKQWTYAWFNKPHKIRDTLEGILGAVSKATPLVSAGMNLAPSFVSLPWTFISLTIPFIMSDFSQMEGAISGLQEVTCILGSYNLVEQEFLLNPVVRDEFKSTVLDLYTKIFEYQASVAQYFAASTLKRLGRNIFSGTPWEDALAGVKKAESLCHRPVDALSVRLHQVSFKTLEDLVREQSISLNRAIEEVTARRKQHRDIMEWISPINPFQDHAELCGRLGDAYLGSGRWLFEDERFTSWHQSSSGFLLLQGVVGTGKSSLISIAIEHLMTRSDGRLAFFYCSENSSSQVSVNAAPSTSITIRNDTTNIFRSILAQCSILLDGSIADPIYEAFKRSSRQAAGESDLSLEATLKLLQDVLRVRDDQITLVFDALDELADYDSFLDNLTTLYGIGEKIRVLVSSRPSIDVPAEVPTLCVETISIQSQTAMDIKDYIEREVTQRSLKSKLDPTHAERLKKALVTFSEGVFRWVVLELDIFLPRSRRQGRTSPTQDFEKRLVKLEQSRAPAIDRLFQAYDQIYDDAVGDDEDYRRCIVETSMKLVLCSLRPLSAKEIHALVGLELGELEERNRENNDSGSTNSSAEDTTIGSNISEKDILQFCSNFIIETPRGMVKLAHLSVRQYFEEKKEDEFSFAQQHLQAALGCVIFSELEKDWAFYGDTFKELKTIMAYSQRFWSIHCRYASESRRLEDIMLSLHPTFSSIYFETMEPSKPEKLPILRFCSLRPTTEEMKCLLFLIASKARLDEPDAYGNTALHNAVLRGSVEQVQLLLDVDGTFNHTSKSRHVKLNNQDDSNSPLHLAASQGFLTIFRLLLFAGSNSLALNAFGLTPLHIAVLFGQEAIVKLAIEYGLDLNVPDESHGTLLHTAAFCNNRNICELLLNAGADRERRNVDRLTASQVATSCRSWNVIPLFERLDPRTSLIPNDRQIDTPLAFNDWTRGPLGGLENFESNAQVGSERPRLYVDSSDFCKYCDVEGWLEASRKGLKCPYWPSPDEFGQSIANGCPLCQGMSSIIVDLEESEEPEELATAKKFDIQVKASLAADSANPTQGRDLLTVFVNDVSYLEFEFCVDDDSRDAASSTVPNFPFQGRSIREHSYVADPIVKSWLASCCDQHPACQKFQETELPTRLLDIGPGDREFTPRLISTKDQTGISCFAFSSCQPTNMRSLVTLISNVQERCSGISWSELEGTRDIIEILRILGYRYLFLNYLCIIHDSPEDMETEMRLLSCYISAADLVLSFPKGREPLARLNYEYCYNFLPLKIRLSPDGKAFPVHLRRPLSPAKEAMNRVLLEMWETQEAILARRIVIVAAGQLLWNCGSCLRTCGHAGFDKPVLRNIQSLEAFAMELKKLPIPNANLVAKTHVFDQWYQYVEIISSRELAPYHRRYDPSAGIDESIGNLLGSLLCEKATTSSQGIRLDDIERSLLWTVRRKEIEEEKPGDKRKYFNRPPNWSWVSTTLPVSYRLASVVKIETEQQLGRNHLKFIEYTELEYIDFRRGSIKLEGAVYEISATNHIAGCEYLFDSNARMTDLEDDKTLHLLVVSRLAYTATGRDLRWVGLILLAEERCFRRVGVFLGPDCKDNLDGWERKVIELT